ncbi:MAG: tetratricopeptide repeat protein [Acidobacteriota bacterium]
MLKRFTTTILILIATAITAAAQEVEVDRYNITARIDVAASAADVRATLSISNLAQAPKPKLYLRLTKLAKVSNVTVNGSAAQFETADDRRVTTLNQIIITPSSRLAAGATGTVEVSYRIEVPDSSALLHIYPGEVLLSPDAVWFPMPSTVFSLYGPATAPSSVTVSFASAPSGFRAASSGALKSDAAGQFTFDQPLNSLPLIAGGSFDQPLASERGGVKIEVWTQLGISAVSADGKPAASSIASRLSEEAARIIDFFTKTLGPAPAGAVFRIISSPRAGYIVVPGVLVLSEQVFRRESINAEIVEALADAVARTWTDGRARLRGQEPRSAQDNKPAVKARSAAVLRDSVPRYLSVLYFEDRFGRDAARAMLGRMRWAYTPVAQSGRDSELGVQTIALPNYPAAVLNKGPLVLRLLAETMGPEKFIASVRSLFSGAQTRILTNEELKTSLVKAGGPEVEKLFQQWIDSIIEPDLIVGGPLPSDKPGWQRVNVRNLGTGDVTVALAAVTASGKRAIGSVAVPSENIAAAELQTSEQIASLEVDPEKLIVQTNYDNDARDIAGNALRTTAQTLFNESIALFNKGQQAEAEAKLREAIRREPDNPLLHAWLARTLVALKKMDEASAEAAAALKVDPPVVPARAWAHIAQGQVALARNQAAEAARLLRLGFTEAEEGPAQFAAIESLIQANAAAKISPQVEEPVRALIASLDVAIKQPSSDKLLPLVVRNNLKKFVQGLTLSRPASWTTEILHADQIDANRVALIVGLKVKSEGRDQAGTAVFILIRGGGGWLMEDVQLFNVK